ncbi:uncharacterized protein LOC127284389 [Leptopilina boulardi]|uniref:uncharacterized protein LOC127284389 n=1 Tax=Leptopilina boulardi TaxID=63433 RepID=UPI0021F5FC40|nr:uncharacterized protein LOC127284389 [Leptopilina boulardi]
MIGTPRRRLSLKAGSIPSIFPNNIHLDNQREFHNGNAAAVSLTPNSPILPSSEIQPNQSFEMESPSSRISDSVQDNQNLLATPKRKSSTDYNENNVADHIIRLLDSSPLERTYQVPCEESNETSSVPYALQDLLENWKLRNAEEFPKYWTRYDIGQEGLHFGYNGDALHQFTRTITVNENMQVKIRVNNRISNFDIINKISSIEDLRFLMITLMSLKLCTRAGTAICENGVFLPTRRSEFCKSCAIKVHKEKERQRRKEKLLDKHKEAKAKVIRNIKLKYQRSRKKIDSLEKQIAEALRLNFLDYLF